MPITPTAKSLIDLSKPAMFDHLGTPHIPYTAPLRGGMLTGGTFNLPGAYAHLVGRPQTSEAEGRLVIAPRDPSDFIIFRFYARHATDANGTSCTIRISFLSPTAEIDGRDLMGKLAGQWVLEVGDTPLATGSQLAGVAGGDYGWVSTISEDPIGALAIGDATLGGAQYLGCGDDGVRELCLRSDGCSLIVIEMETESEITLGVLYRPA